jgi:hypothetical protein
MQSLCGCVQRAEITEIPLGMTSARSETAVPPPPILLCFNVKLEHDVIKLVPHKQARSVAFSPQVNYAD